MNKRAYHFNFIDVILICSCILIILVLFSLFLFQNSNYDLLRKDTVQISLHIEKIPQVQSDKILINDPVFLQLGDDELGKVKKVSVSKTPLEISVSDSEQPATYYFPEYRDIVIEIECKAYMNDDSIDINGNKYAVSDVIGFYVPGFSGSGTITSLEVVK